MWTFHTLRKKFMAIDKTTGVCLRTFMSYSKGTNIFIIFLMLLW